MWQEGMGAEETKVEGTIISLGVYLLAGNPAGW